MPWLRGLDVLCCLLRLLSSVIILIFLTPSIIKASHKSEIEWMALNIYHEARGEDFYGKMAIAIVTINRVESKKYPNNIHEVVTQKNQFSWYWDGKSDIPRNKKSWDECLFISKFIYNLWRSKILKKQIEQFNFNKIKWYHRYDTNPPWSYRMNRICKIGHHYFYRGYE